MSDDPVATLLLEAEQEAGAEREERQILLGRLKAVEEQLATIMELLQKLTVMEREEPQHNGKGRTITVLARDEHDRIEKIEVH